MPRGLRLNRAGEWYHLTARGIERRAIFLDDRDRRHFLGLLEEWTERFQLRAHAYVLMDNHYHVLAQLGEANLSRAVQWLNVSYAAWFNRRRGRAGYLFQGRFKSVVVDAPRWAVGLSAYIHLNPVRVARLGLSKANRQQEQVWRVEAPSRELIAERLRILRDFRWSSFDAYTRAGSAPKWLDVESVLKLQGGRADDRRANYRKLVEDQVRGGGMPSPWEELRDRAVLGGEEMVARLKASAADVLKGKKIEPPKWARAAATWDEVVSAVEKAKAEKWDAFKDRYGDRGRDLAIYLARRATRLTAANLAERVGLKSHAHVSMACRRYANVLDNKKRDKAIAKRAAEMLHVML